jgi:ribose transport system ATP-binding protein
MSETVLLDRAPGAAAPAPAPALELRGIAKSFPGVQALAGVDLVLRHGEIHALLGENGAGKSTLLKIVTGVYRPDAGTVRVEGVEQSFATPRDAIRAGIGVVHQERNLIPRFSVAENVTLEQPPARGAFIDRARMNADARRWLEALELPLDPDTPVERLSVAQMQLVEIAKALSLRTRILLLDEPTASITPHEAAILFGILRRLRDEGAAILFVSHKLEEVFALCDRVTVLRDGRQAALDLPLADLDRDPLVTLMIGRSERVADLGEKAAIAGAPAVLEARDLRADSGTAGVSFALRPGEVLGLYGLVGAGRSELARALIGDARVTGGQVLVDGAPVRIGSPREALERYRIGYVSENRQREGLILPHSVQSNVAVTVWERLRNALGWIGGRAEREAVEPHVRALAVKTPSLAQAVGNLSGGNQQKVSLAKWLAANTRVLIIDEPTVGIDVKTKHELHELIWDLSRRGLAILLISSDMPEMIRLADRILVMKGHRIVGEVANSHEYAAVSEAIMAAIHERPDAG